MADSKKPAKGPDRKANRRGAARLAAVQALYQMDIAGAGINEIVRVSGAPKGSVYHYFPDGKLQIAGEALSHYSKQVVAFIDASLSKKREPAEKVTALFDAFARRVEAGDFKLSCAAGTVCLDLDADVAELRPVVAATFDAYVAVIAGHFPFNDRARARSFASLLLTAIEGAYIRCRADRSSEPFREAGAWLATLVRRPPR